MIVTLDLDFGYLYRILSPHKVGIIILRLTNQTVESVNTALGRLHASVAVAVVAEAPQAHQGRDGDIHRAIAGALVAQRLSDQPQQLRVGLHLVWKQSREQADAVRQ